MHKVLVTATLGAMLAAAQTQPTAAELLQKGIYAQETAGDLESAVKIYRQIVDSHPIQKEIAAQAQYRLGMTLLQKGDAALASQEIQRLAWDFPDYKDLIASSKASTANQGRFTVGRTISFSVVKDQQFDFNKPITITGTVSQVQWINPTASLTVNVTSAGGTQSFRVSLDSPSKLGAVGWDRNTVIVGDQVTVTGAPALDGSSTVQATSVTTASKSVFSLVAAAGTNEHQNKSFDFFLNADVSAGDPRAAAADQDLAKRDALEAHHDAAYDFSNSKTMTVTGTIAQVEWADPLAWMTVTPPDGAPPVRVSLESVGGRLRGGKNALKAGDQVTVIGAPARDGTSSIQATRVSANGALKYLRGTTAAK